MTSIQRCRFVVASERVCEWMEVLAHTFSVVMQIHMHTLLQEFTVACRSTFNAPKLADLLDLLRAS